MAEPGKLFEHQPTVRLDYNITGNHRLSGSAQFIKAQRDPDYLNGVDARFPGAPNYRLFTSTRPLYSTSLRSTLSQNIVNEVQFGITQGGASDCIQLRTGDCAPDELIIRAPWFTRFDVGIRKKFPLMGAMNLESALELLNVLDNVNFNQTSAPGSSAAIFQVGSAYTDSSNRVPSVPWVPWVPWFKDTKGAGFPAPFFTAGREESTGAELRW